jgi:hypothetical protein
MSARHRLFHVHASLWFAVNAMLFVIWMLAGAGHPWFLYPAMGWGIGLAAHATLTFNRPVYDDELEGRRGHRRLGR